MNQLSSSKNTTVFWLLYIAAIGWLMYLLMPYFGVIVLSIVSAYMASPIHNYTKKKFDKNRVSLLATRWSIILVVLAPLALIIWLLWAELSQIVNDVSANNSLQSILWSIQPYIKSLSFDTIDINTDALQEQILGMLQSALWSVGSITSYLWSSIVEFVTSSILYIFVTTWLLTHHAYLITYIKKILPINTNVLETYLERLWKMVSWIISSTVVIALLQWLVTALSFTVVGIPYFIFFMALASLLAIIPMLWAAVLAMIVWVVMMLIGNIRAGIFIILVNQVIVNNIDNILRPKLIAEWARINDTLLIISVFSGLALWWVWWLLYGPLIMSFVLTTFEQMESDLKHQ